MREARVGAQDGARRNRTARVTHRPTAMWTMIHGSSARRATAHETPARSGCPAAESPESGDATTGSQSLSTGIPAGAAHYVRLLPLDDPGKRNL